MTEHANPLTAWGSIPRFGSITAADVAPAMSATLARCEADLSALEVAADELDADALIAGLEPIEDRLGWTWTLVNHMNAVRTHDALREAIQAVQPEVVAFSTRMGQSEALYRAYRRMRDDAGFGGLPSASQRVITLGLRAAEHAGIGLSGPAKDRFNANRKRLAELGLAFGNHVLDATKSYFMDLSEHDEVRGLPDSLKGLAAQTAAAAGHTDATAKDGPWRITLDYPVFGPFIEHSERRDLRERIYRAFVTRASSGELDNMPLVEEILALRDAQAQLLGYASYAALSVASKMAPDVGAVGKLLAELHASSYPAAESELAELTAFAQAHGHQGAVQNWDHAYWARRLKRDRFDFDDEVLRPYFALPAVLRGLFELAEVLFDVRVTANDTVAGWHPDVRYYDVRAIDTGEICAGFFLDPYSRPADKRGGAWMNECVVRSRALAAPGQRVRVPVAYLVTNQMPPVGDTPSLMTFREVQTLFHEFGHGLQHMLTQVDVAPVAGINGVEWDAVELPSQFMENWLRHRPTLLSFARHYQTGEPVPDALLDRLLAAQTFRAGTGFLRQIYFARLDLALHSAREPDTSVAEIKAAVAADNTVIPPLPDDRFLCAFSHLFAGGYAAGYYSYKWAEVLSADAFGAFEEAGLDAPERVRAVGRRFRDTVLALGGSVDPMTVFERFRGRGPSVEALLRHNGLKAA